MRRSANALNSPFASLVLSRVPESESLTEEVRGFLRYFFDLVLDLFSTDGGKHLWTSRVSTNMRVGLICSSSRRTRTLWPTSNYPPKLTAASSSLGGIRRVRG